VGAIFRTADAAGIACVYLTGYTPTPLDRFGRKRGDIAKTALGAEKTIAWEHLRMPQTVMRDLKARGFQIVAVEQAEDAVDYKTFRPKQKTAFLFGNEVRGISRSLLKKSDALIEIPMRGKKESLNVSVAVGIVLFRTLNI